MKEDGKLAKIMESGKELYEESKAIIQEKGIVKGGKKLLLKNGIYAVNKATKRLRHKKDSSQSQDD